MSSEDVQRPNIVLICVDQMRHDCLSIAGHPAVETPMLDTLAADGVRFTNAYSAVPSCIAARASLFTGLKPETHGRVGYRDGVTWNYETTLAGEMTKAGYQTISVGKMHVHPQRNKVGFEDVVLHDGMLHCYGHKRESDYEDWVKAELGPDCGLFDHGLPANSWVARPWHLPEYTHPTYWATSRAVEFLGKRDESRPFFMFLSYVAPHPPLAPPRCYFDQYDNQDLPAPPIGDWADNFVAGDQDTGRFSHSTLRGKLDPRAQHRAQAGYYGLITQIDHQIGRFIEYCSEYDVLKNTVFMFVSDHGEQLGDHYLFRKTLPYAGSARVPLIMKFPQGWIEKRHQTYDHPVELRDIMPTVLDIAGAPIPESVEGRSLLGLAKGEDTPWRQYIHGEHPIGDLANHYITDGKHLYAWYSQTGVEQFFHTEKDPHEMHNLIDDPAQGEIIDRFRKLLIKELQGREEGYSDGEKLIVGCEPTGVLSHILDQDG